MCFPKFFWVNLPCLFPIFAIFSRVIMDIDQTCSTFCLSTQQLNSTCHSLKFELNSCQTAAHRQIPAFASVVSQLFLTRWNSAFFEISEAHYPIKLFPFAILLKFVIGPGLKFKAVWRVFGVALGFGSLGMLLGRCCSRALLVGVFQVTIMAPAISKPMAIITTLKKRPSPEPACPQVPASWARSVSEW